MSEQFKITMNAISCDMIESDYSNYDELRAIASFIITDNCAIDILEIDNHIHVEFFELRETVISVIDNIENYESYCYRANSLSDALNAIYRKINSLNEIAN